MRCSKRSRLQIVLRQRIEQDHDNRKQQQNPGEEARLVRWVATLPGDGGHEKDTVSADSCLKLYVGTA